MKLNGKRLLSALLCFVVLATVFAGCGQEAVPANAAQTSAVTATTPTTEDLITTALTTTTIPPTTTALPASQTTVTEATTTDQSAAEKYYFNSTAKKAGDGYSEADGQIGKKDPHFGWELGSFLVSGYTRVKPDGNGTPVIIKTPGDKIAFRFQLEEDIDQLNGNERLLIADDKKGYDQAFGVAQSADGFGRGTLIIQKTDYQNKPSKPTIYRDFLSAETETNANTMVEFFEEGDYEVALDYRITKIEVKVGNVNVLPIHANYTIRFRFSIRNGSCMAYPFDTVTKSELGNNAITSNGFYIDTAKSKYLDINITYEALAYGSGGASLDVRFNRPVKNDEEFREEGIYTILVSNRYTGEKTTKRLCVGSDPALLAHMR